MIPNHVTAAVDQALKLLPGKMDTPEARVMLFAIGLQESGFEYRRQVIKSGGLLLPLGPAKGYWQFERRGGCYGVVSHFASRYWMADVCAARNCAFTSAALWDAIENDDVLAAAAARLLLFTDQHRLPALSDVEGAWKYYLRVWGPGKPHPTEWPGRYAKALAHVKGAQP